MNSDNFPFKLQARRRPSRWPASSLSDHTKACPFPQVSCAHIFWDLDNVRPSSLQELHDLGNIIISAVLDLDLTMYRFNKLNNEREQASNKKSSLFPDETTVYGSAEEPSLLLSIAPRCGNIGFTVFANPTTISLLSTSMEYFASCTTGRGTPAPSQHNHKFQGTLIQNHNQDLLYLRDLESVVESLNGILVQTTGRKQSVDLAMRSAMLDYIKANTTNSTLQYNSNTTNGSTTITAAPLLACISDDSDFVQILKYCRSLGCTTVSIGEHKGRKIPSWAAPRRIDNLPLPAAASAAITLRRPPQMTNHINKDSDEREQWSIARVWINPKAY